MLETGSETGSGLHSCTFILTSLIEKNRKYNCASLTPFLYRDIALKVGLDTEIINLDVNKVLLQQYHSDKPSPTVNLDNYKKLNLTIFDYLSKTSHWNPRIFIDLVGFNKDNDLGYTPEYLRLCLIELTTFISCMTIFVEIFLSHFFNERFTNDLNSLKLLQSEFENHIMEILDVPDKKISA